MNQEPTTSIVDALNEHEPRVASQGVVSPPLSNILESLCAESPQELGHAMESASPIPRALVLEPGLHAATLEALFGDVLVARLLDGRRTRASVLPQVALALVEQCLADNRLVLLANGAEGPVMAGALQTTPMIAHDREGNLHIRAKRLRIHADEEIRVETGLNAVVTESNADGRVRLRCEHGSLDFAANLRVHSALVELP